MTCDCAEEEITVVRKLNKTLRTMNKVLREKLRIVQEHTDEIFVALCELPGVETGVETGFESSEGGLPEDDIRG